MSSCVIASIAGRAASPEKQGMFQSALNLAIQVGPIRSRRSFLWVLAVSWGRMPGQRRVATQGVQCSGPCCLLDRLEPA